jgi:hypothetical protein
MTQPTPNQKLVDAILHRASVDAAFRTQLLASPGTAVYEAFGIRLPAGVQVKFIERDPAWNAVYLLPDLHADDEELSETELESVAGGVEPYAWDGGGS